MSLILPCIFFHKGSQANWIAKEIAPVLSRLCLRFYRDPPLNTVNIVLNVLTNIEVHYYTEMRTYLTTNNEHSMKSFNVILLAVVHLICE